MPHRDRSRQREAERRWYAANKQRVLEKKRRKRERLREHVRMLKSRPCADCGVAYPYYVMDFDHVRGDKVMLISELALRNATTKLVAELEKCEVVCANCHRVRTWVRMQQAGGASSPSAPPCVVPAASQLSLFASAGDVDSASG